MFVYAAACTSLVCMHVCMSVYAYNVHACGFLYITINYSIITFTHICKYLSTSSHLKIAHGISSIIISFNFSRQIKLLNRSLISARVYDEPLLPSKLTLASTTDKIVGREKIALPSRSTKSHSYYFLTQMRLFSHSE